jgi:hypothetical protein
MREMLHLVHHIATQIYFEKSPIDLIFDGGVILFLSDAYSLHFRIVACRFRAATMCVSRKPAAKMFSFTWIMYLDHVAFVASCAISCY